MSENSLTQAEADALIEITKAPVNDRLIQLPDFGGEVQVLLQSCDRQEKFVLNYRRGRINLLKRTHHLRGRQVIGLVRLDLNGAPHRNPDKKEVGSNHLHLYKEGWGLKWAVTVPKKQFPDPDNTYRTLMDFLKYIHVVEEPNFDRRWFS